jgi:hypothetical protein
MTRSTGFDTALQVEGVTARFPPPQGTGVVAYFGLIAKVFYGDYFLRSCLFLFAGDNTQTLYPDLLVNIYVLLFWSRGEFMMQLRSEDPAQDVQVYKGIRCWCTMYWHSLA